MKVLVTGGVGFVGTNLIIRLLKDGHEVTSLDTNWFDDNLEDHPLLTKINEDIRNINSIPMNGIDSIIQE